MISLHFMGFLNDHMVQEFEFLPECHFLTRSICLISRFGSGPQGFAKVEQGNPLHSFTLDVDHDVFECLAVRLRLPTAEVHLLDIGNRNAVCCGRLDF